MSGGERGRAPAGVAAWRGGGGGGGGVGGGGGEWGGGGGGGGKFRQAHAVAIADNGALCCFQKQPWLRRFFKIRGLAGCFLTCAAISEDDP